MYKVLHKLSKPYRDSSINNILSTVWYEIIFRHLNGYNSANIRKRISTNLMKDNVYTRLEDNIYKMFRQYLVPIGNVYRIGYMSEIKRMHNLSVSWWHATSCATICLESCLGGVPKGLGCPESCLGRRFPNSLVLCWQVLGCAT